MDLLLQVLHVKGRATLEGLAAALRTERAGLDAAVAGFVDAGLVEDSRFGFKLTEQAKARVDELYARERGQAGAVVDDVYAAFGPLDDEVKQIVTDWQMRPVGGEPAVNDHTDHRYDQGVLARLRRTDGKVAAALAPLTAALPRFGLYLERLGLALARIDAGDRSMVAAPLADSYHTVWFELHEELITLAGRTREE